MLNYNIGNTELLVRQGLNAKEEIDFSEIRASILKDVFVQTDSLNKLEELEEQQKLQDIPDIKTELAALYPDITNYSLSTTTINHIDTTQSDTVTLAVFKFKNRKSRSETDKLRQWLKSRTQRDSVKLIIE